MIASATFPVRASLGVRRAAKFAAPDDKRLLQHAALLEILNEGGTGLVDVFGERDESLLKP